MRELRHPDDVFAADSLASLRSAPVTIGHPMKDGALVWVSPSNARDLEVGVCSEGTPAGKFVDAEISVRRDDAIARVDSKDLCEISLGYDSKVVPEQGVFEGQPYTQRQTNIRYNHVALLGQGKSRMKDTVIRADSSDAVTDDEPIEPRADSSAGPQPGLEKRMRMVRIDGIEYEIPDPAASAVEKVLAVNTAEKKRADSAEAERDLIKGDLAKAKDPKTIAALVQSRVGLERSASKVLGADQRIDGLTDREVQEAVIKKTRPEFTLEGRTDDAVSAAYEYAIASVDKTDQGLEAVKTALTEPPPKRADKDDEQKQKAELQKLEQERRDAWKPKVLRTGTGG